MNWNRYRWKIFIAVLAFAVTAASFQNCAKKGSESEASVAVKCRLAADLRNVPPGGDVTYQLEIVKGELPEGATGYWTGSYNYDARDMGNVAFADEDVLAPQVVRNNSGDWGVHKRKAHIQDAAGNDICESNDTAVIFN